MEPVPSQETTAVLRWRLIRDLGVLQVKLLIDGFRDVLLVPASVVAGIVSLVRTENGRPGKAFYEVISLGEQSDRWINLFGALRNAPPEVVDGKPFGDADIDELVSRVENFVVDEYRRGGVTAQAMARIEKALSSVRRGGRTGEGER
jgi:hypothetical protein